MKRKIAFAAAAILITGFAIARTVYRGPLANEYGLTYTKNYTFNVANYGIDQLAATASYSSMTVTSQSFTDGTASTGAITVTSVTGLAGTQGTDYLTVLSTNGLSGSSISIGGTTLTESIHWYTQTSTAAVATSIKTAINTYATQFVAAVTAPTNRVNISCASSGTWCNNQSLTVVGTSSITANAAAFSGGVDNAIIAINNVALIQGTDWTVGASTAATANAIATAINANSSLAPVITATAPVVCGLSNPCGVVALTADSVGTSTNYALYVSSYPALTPTAPITTGTPGRATSVMTGGTNAAFTPGSASITITSNPFWAPNNANGQQPITGMAVLYTSSTIALSGLTNQTTYYVIPVDQNTIKLASSNANAVAGTAITITSSSTQTTAHTFTLAPLAITGTPSGKWQVSNDGVLWQDFTTTSSGVAVSSFTVSSYTAGGASTSWDFGRFGYAYIRLAVIGPTTGALNLLVTMNGKSDSNR